MAEYDKQNEFNPDILKLLDPKDMRYAKYVKNKPHWHMYEDGSGYFVGVTGKRCMEIDLLTDEIRLNGRWRYLDADTDYEKLYLTDMMHNELVTASLAEKGIEYIRTNTNVNLNILDKNYVALDEDTIMQVIAFRNLLSECHALEQKNWSDSTLHCNELADMILKAISNGTDDKKLYHFSYEHDELSFASDSIKSLETFLGLSDKENSDVDLEK